MSPASAAPSRTPARPRSRPRRKTPVAPVDSFELRHTVLHGHSVAYRSAGSGPAIVLIHGITSNSLTWEAIAPSLARNHTVIAPDLLGHGQSAKPRGDYSLGAYASGVRDLLVSLGHESATVVGHSLGGGVAMQMAYQFPERCERLVLVGSGGLGREVSGLLRAATLPGSEWILPFLASAGLLDAGRVVARLLDRLGLSFRTDVQEMASGHASLADPEARAAFVHTLRTIVDPGGQRVNASDRLYLAQEVPTMIVWGERDPIIPVAHGRAAHELIPNSRLEVFANAGHYPHVDDAARFGRVLEDFIDSTEPAAVTPERWRALLQKGS
ncbi:MAG: alpha/beta fold hydrolase [Solirubrobacteraceae bacterium]